MEFEIQQIFQKICHLFKNQHILPLHHGHSHSQASSLSAPFRTLKGRPEQPLLSSREAILRNLPLGPIQKKNQPSTKSGPPKLYTTGLGFGFPSCSQESPIFLFFQRIFMEAMIDIIPRGQHTIATFPLATLVATVSRIHNRRKDMPSIAFFGALRLRTES